MEGGWGASEKRLRTVKGAENLITAVRSCNSYTFTFIVPLNGAFIRSNHGLARNCDVTTRRFRAGLPSLTAEPAVAPRTVAKLFSESTANLIFRIFLIEIEFEETISVEDNSFLLNLYRSVPLVTHT